MRENEGRRRSDEQMDNLMQRAVFLLFIGYEACFSPFLRCGLGSRYIANGFFGGSVVMFLWAYNYPAEELIPFGCLWMGALFIQKIISLRMEARGIEIHRDFGGEPSLVKALPLIGRLSDGWAWCLFEPGLVFLASFGMDYLSPALGRFFAWGSYVMAFHARIGVAALKEQAAEMRDARLHGQYFARRQEGRW